MNSKMRVAVSLVSTAVTTSLVTALAPSSAMAACQYRPTDLPLTSGATNGVVTTAAGTGVFAGETEVPVGKVTQEHAALWTGGKVTDLGTVPDAPDSLGVNDVNGAGIVVGSGWKITGHVEGWPIGENYPFRSRDGKLERLPVPSGAHDVVAQAITESGDIYGSGYRTDPNHTTVFFWPADKPGTVTEPTGFPVGSKVEGVDSDGTVAVSAISDSKNTRSAHLWKNGVSKPLPMPAGAKFSLISAISNGRVVGSVESKPVLWDKSAVAKGLPTGTGASDVNRDGLIVGWSSSGASTVWRLTTKVATLPRDARILTVADDGSLGGYNNRIPALWRCA
ncbi:hypothetical protein [Actinomadura rubrisoli]|uniref:HAF repeat-containing protein n=1 Tax=Actinomadura rubrisoli TaxID=2530368 RepID=A0A4R5AX01_9ACTN|nr:hypothetical protein [Actinomadura rubrisoli]TDD76529.1 hypothetical protein E1298_30775 [Actinomadura rubrisoli]